MVIQTGFEPVSPISCNQQLLGGLPSFLLNHIVPFYGTVFLFGAGEGSRTPKFEVIAPADFLTTLSYDFLSHTNACCSLDYFLTLSLHMT